MCFLESDFYWSFTNITEECLWMYEYSIQLIYVGIQHSNEFSDLVERMPHNCIWLVLQYLCFLHNYFLLISRKFKSARTPWTKRHLKIKYIFKVTYNVHLLSSQYHYIDDVNNCRYFIFADVLKINFHKSIFIYCFAIATKFNAFKWTTLILRE